MIMLDKTSRSGRAGRFLLPLSILLNLFFVALIVGHVLQGRLHSQLDRSPLARALAHMEASLAPKDAAAFRAVLSKDAPAYVGAAQRLEAARIGLEAQVLAQPLDKTHLRAAFATWHSAWDAFFDAFSGPLTDALGQISPEGRRKLVAERKSERMGAH